MAAFTNLNITVYAYMLKMHDLSGLNDWAQLARSGKKVMQGRSVAKAVDGRVTRYGKA